MVFGAPTDGFNLGNAHGKVIITANAADAMRQAQNQVRRGIQGVTANLQSMGQNMQQIGGNILTMTSPLLAFTGTGLKVASDFDSALTAISARTGLTGEALESVRQQAIKLGADTMFSSQQAADAFLQLLTAGLDVSQAMDTLPSVLDAAAASGEDLGLSADLVTNVMSSFNVQANESGRIVEAMSRAAASSPASMAEMGFALQDAGGIAKSFGLELEDTAALFALFAQRGIRGSEAATQLRSLLMNMTRDTEDTNQAWDALGTSMFDSEGNMRNLDTVLGEISTALDGMADEQRNEIVRALAGAYGRVGFEALLASDGIEAMKDTMDGQASAAEVAEQRMGTFEGTVDSLKGSFETLQIEALTPFMNETLVPLAEQMTENINKVTEWVQKHPELTQSIIGVGLVVGAFGLGLVLLGTAISAVTGAIGTLLAIGLSPLGIALAFGALLVLAYQNNWLGFRDFIDNEVRPTILDIIKDLERWKGAMDDIKFIIDGINSGKFSVQDTLEAAGKAVVNEIKTSNYDPSNKSISDIWGDYVAAGGWSMTGNDRDREKTRGTAELINFMASRDTGGFGKAGMPYLIGKGAQPEIFVPETNGQFFPNFDKMMQGSGGVQFNGDIIIQGARTYEEGRAAGRGAADGLLERLRSKGY